MSDSNDHVGFSFQLSETPPPARAGGGHTPLGDLDLDLADFGAPKESPEPAEPFRIGSLAGTPAPAESTSTEPAVIDAAPIDAAAIDVAAIDVAPVAAAPLEPASAAPRESSPSVAHDVPSIAATAVLPESPGVAPATTSPIEPTRAPKIKKIEFPARASRKVKAQESARPKTHFSSSIGSEAPRRQLESEPEVEEQQAARHPTDLAPPEDLPDPSAPMLRPSPDAPDWHTDTPSAREIWQKARTSWQSTSRLAVKLGGQSMRASHKFAQIVGDRVVTGIKQAAEERKKAAESQAALQSQASAAKPSSTEGSVAPVTEGKGGGASAPSMAGRVILGLVKSHGRKVAAPASAMAAAAIVYFAGTQLFGTDGSVALSKAMSSPSIPDLGTLEAAKGDEAEKPETIRTSGGEKASNKSGKTASKKEEPSTPEPLTTEVTAMPDGLSWPGKGLIEVVTSEDELIYVDGVFTGRGPLRRIPVTPGKHEVSIRTENTERSGSVEVTVNRNTRAVFR